MTIPITDAVSIPRAELELRAARSSGPGGQHVNKVSTRVILRFHVAASPSIPEGMRARFLATFASRITNEGWLVLSSDTHRSRVRNEGECITRLQEMLRSVATPPKKRRPTRPTRASRERRLQAKRAQSDRKKSRKRPRRGDD